MAEWTPPKNAKAKEPNKKWTPPANAVKKKSEPLESPSQEPTSQSPTTSLKPKYVWGDDTKQVELQKPTSGQVVYEPEIREQRFREKAEKIKEIREKPMVLPDGTESTVKLQSSVIDGKNVVYPTLFPKSKEDYSSSPSDWIELDGIAAYDEAKKRGEIIEFDTQQEADEFANGSWKTDDYYKPEGSIHKVNDEVISRKEIRDNLFNRDFIEGDIRKTIPELTEEYSELKSAREELKAVNNKIYQLEGVMYGDTRKDPNFQRAMEDLNAKKDSLLAVQNDISDKLVHPTYKQEIGKYYNEDGTVKEEYTTKNLYGITVPDVEKIYRDSEKHFQDNGLRAKYKEDVKNSLQFSIDVPKEDLSKRIDENYEKEYGISLSDEVSKEQLKGFGSKYGELLNDLYSKSKSTIDSAATSINKEVAALTKVNQARIDELTAAYKKAAPQAATEAQSQKLYSEYTNAVNGIIAEQAQKENEYSSKINRLVREQNEIYSAKAKEYSDAYAKEYSISPEIKAKLDKVSIQSVEELQDKANEGKKTAIALRDWQGGSRLMESTIASFGGVLQGWSTTMGGTGEMGERLETYFQPNVAPIQSLKDVTLFSLRESTGSLVGSMLPSVVASAVAAYTTRNAGLTSQILISGAAGWTAETIDMTGRAYKEALEKTGSEAAAENAASEMFDGQVALSPLYLAEGLPFVGAFKKIANPVLRIGTGAAVEYTTEFFQEYPQGLMERSIQETGRFENFTDYHSTDAMVETGLNLLPVLGLGGAGAIKREHTSTLESNPDIAMQQLGDMIHEKGKQAADLEISLLYRNGLIDKTTFEFLGNQIDNYEVANSKEYNALAFRRDQVEQSIEQEQDPVKRKLMGESVSAYNSLMEKVIKGVPIGLEYVDINGKEYVKAPSNPILYNDLLDGKIDESTAKDIESIFERRGAFNSTLEVVSKGERVNENRINNAISDGLLMIKEIENANLSEDEKANYIELIEDEIENLENYEFTTETETRKVAEAKTVRVRKNAERKAAPKEQRILDGRKAVFTDNKGDGSKGVIKLEETPDGKEYYVLEAEAPKEVIGAKSSGEKVDRRVAPIEGLDRKVILGEKSKVFNESTTNFDSEGNPVSVTFPQKNKGQVTIKDPELAREIEVEKAKQEEFDNDFFEETYIEFVGTEKVEVLKDKKQNIKTKTDSEQSKHEAEQKEEKVSNEVDKVKATKEKEQKIKTASKELADKVRSAKISKTYGDLSTLQSSGIFQAAWDGALSAVALTIEAGGTIAQAVNDGLVALKNSDWYKNLSEDGKKKAATKFKRGVTAEIKQNATTEQISRGLESDKDAKNELTQFASREMRKAKVGVLGRGKIMKFMRNTRDVTIDNFKKKADELREVIDKESKIEKEFFDKLNKAFNNLKHLGTQTESFKKLLTINPNSVPESKKDAYNDLIDRLSKRGAKLEDVKADIQLADEIINSINEEDLKIIGEFDNEELSPEENKAILQEKKKELEKRKSKLRDDILELLPDNFNDVEIIDPNDQIYLGALSELQEEDLEFMNLSELTSVKVGIERALSGIVNHSVSRGAINVAAARNARNIYNQLQGIDKVNWAAKILGAGAKSFRLEKMLGWNQKKRQREIAKRASSGAIDALLGMKGTAIEDSLDVFEVGYSNYEAEYSKAMAALKKAYSKIGGLLAPRRARLNADINAMLYMLQKHYLSNKDSGLAHSVNDIIDENKKARSKYITKYGDKSYQYMVSQVDKFTKDGIFDIDAFYSSLSKGEKGLIKTAQNINKSLAPYAMHAKVVGRGENIAMLDDYIHYPVLLEAMKKILDPVESFKQSGKVGTKGGSLEARTKGAKAMNISLIESMSRGVRDVLMDYYLTPAFRQERKTMDILERMTKGNEAQEDLSDVLKTSTEAKRTLLLDNAIVKSERNPLLDFIQAAAYKYLLGTIRRAFVETTTNMMYLALRNISKGRMPLKSIYRSINGTDSDNMTKVIDKDGSNQKARLLGGYALAAHGDIIAMDNGSGLISPNVRSGSKKIADWFKRYTKYPSDIAEGAIRIPDNALARAVWMNEYEDAFKKHSGEALSWDKAANDSEYRKTNRKAMESARKVADKELKVGFSTVNKAGRSEAQLLAAKEGGLKRIKYFMLPFIINEYEQSLKAVVNNKGASSLGVTVPVMARMSMYGVGMDMMGSAFAYTMLEVAKGLGWDDTDDDKYGSLLDVLLTDADDDVKRNIVSSIITTIMLRNTSGYVRLPANAIVEAANAIWGREVGLRDGSYNKYKNNLMFNRISSDSKPEDVLFTLVPELQPIGSGTVDVGKWIEKGFIKKDNNGDYKFTDKGLELIEKRFRNVFLGEDMPEKDKEKMYKLEKGLSTIMASMNIIPRDFRDMYTYYKNRHLILKDKHGISSNNKSSLKPSNNSSSVITITIN